MLNGVELFYSVDLPADWNCDHPVGTVLGKATYGSHFFFYQGCTVGCNIHDDKFVYPVLGNNVTMYSGSKVLGNCNVGNNVIFAANSFIIDRDVPSNVVVIGQGKDVLFKERKERTLFYNE